MKNIIKLFGTVAIVAIIVFSIAACIEPDGGGKGGTPKDTSTPITSVEVYITPPVKGETPVLGADTDDGHYSVGAVTWTQGTSPVSGAFAGNVAYTATVTLTANEGYTFTGLQAANAKIGSHTATISNNTGSTVTLSYTFAPTLDKNIKEITITSQPLLIYTHGEHLDLSGLTVTLTFEDESTVPNVTLEQFDNYSLSTMPADDAVLRHIEHNNEPIEVRYGTELTRHTDNMTVNKKELTLSVIATNRPYNGGTNVTLTAGTLQGVVSGDEVGFNPVSTGTIADAGVGTGKAVTVPEITLIGANAGNYTLTQPSGVTVNITKAAIAAVQVTITGPVTAQPASDVATPPTGSNYTVGTVSWFDGETPHSGNFYGDVAYTVQITLTTNGNHTFTGLAAASAHINGQAASFVGTPGDTVTLSYTFSKTTKPIASLTIDTQPETDYTHGDTLDLSLLRVTISYTDSTSDASQTYQQLAAKNITISPSHGDPLRHIGNNGNPVKVGYGLVGIEANTNPLTVNTKKLTISGITATNRNYEAGNLTVALNYTAAALQGVVSGDEVDFSRPANGEIATANVGTKAVTIPTINLSGNDEDNYTLTQPEGVNVTINRKPVDGTVIITVTAPQTAAAPNHTATISSGTGFSVGTVTWLQGNSAFNGSKFLGNTAYTARVTLSADGNHSLADLVSSTARIDGENTTSLSAHSETSVTLSHTFGATGAPTPTGLAITTQPELTYIHGDNLDLSAMRVTVTFNDDTTKTNQEYQHLTDSSIGLTISPPNNTQLIRSNHNGNTIAVGVGQSYVQYTNPLTINRTTGAAVSAPSAASATVEQTSITIAAVTPPAGQIGGNQTVEYGISTSNSAQPGTFGTSLTFNGLTANTVYYVWARSAQNGNYNAGTAVASGAIRTLPLTGTGGGIVYYWVDNHDNLVTSGSATVTAGSTLAISLNPGETGYTVVRWQVNGITQEGQTGTTFNFIGTSVGTNTITLTVSKGGKIYTSNIVVTVN
jgi:hypothetical protein